MVDKKIVKFLSVLSIFILFSCILQAQQIIRLETNDSDVGMRFSAEVTKKLSRNWSGSWEEEFRLRDNISAMDRLYSGLSVSYDVSPYFSTSLAYQHQLINHEGKPSTDYQEYWDFRHKGVLSGSFTYPIGQFELSLRQRFDMTLRTDSINPEEANNPKLEARTRVELQYSFWATPLKPYASVEMFNPLNNVAYTQDEWLTSMRYTAGLTYRLDARTRVELYYFFENENKQDVNIGRNNPNKVTITTEKEQKHVIGIAYKYKF